MCPVLPVLVGCAVLAWASLTSAGSTPSASTYSVAGEQAQEISVAVQFVNAFNAHDLSAALTLLTKDVAVSDCDYRRVEAVEFDGTHEVRGWLHRRFADHDYLGLARVFDENPAQPIGVLGLAYSARRSDTLRALGFPRGIKPEGATKVVFTKRRPIRIRGFANGPIGGSRELCRPN